MLRVQMFLTLHNNPRVRQILLPQVLVAAINNKTIVLLPQWWL